MSNPAPHSATRHRGTGTEQGPLGLRGAVADIRSLIRVPWKRLACIGWLVALASACEMALLVLITQLALALGNAEPVTFALLGQLEPTAAYSIAFALLVVGTAMRSASDWLTAKTVAHATCEMRRTVVNLFRCYPITR